MTYIFIVFLMWVGPISRGLDHLCMMPSIYRTGISSMQVFLCKKYISAVRIKQRLNVLQTSQKTQDVDPMLVECWPTIYDAGPTLNQYSHNVLYLSGYLYRPLGYERVYLPLCKVTDTPFHIQEDDILFSRHVISEGYLDEVINYSTAISNLRGALPPIN